MKIHAGQQIGSYRVLRELGRGGMATVYEAVHHEIAQRAALKVLAADLARDPVMTARFLNEARAVNIVRHPGLVSIFEFGRLPADLGGGAFIVMEFLEGETLHQRIGRTTPLPVAEALRLARQIASALAAAHEKGIVHRDLKPGNVMIVRDSDMAGGERTKILDFGIAKLSALATAAQQPMTQTGVVLGTPEYMSPEQCNGADLVTDRTDVYALGVMLFEMLSGSLPFKSERPMELMGMHLFRQAPPLAERVAGLPAEVAALVQAMLAKDHDQRPSMAQVAQALQDLGAPGSLVGLPLLALAAQTSAQPLTTIAAGPGAVTRSSAPIAAAPGRAARVLPGRTAAALVVAALVASGGLTALLMSRRSQGVTPRAPAPRPVVASPAPAPAPTPARAPSPALAPAAPPEKITPVAETRPPRRRSAPRVTERTPPAAQQVPAQQLAPAYRGTKAAIDTTYPGSP